MIFFYIDADGTIAVGSDQIKVTAPRDVVKAPKSNDEERVEKNELFNFSEKRKTFPQEMDRVGLN